METEETTIETTTPAKLPTKLKEVGTRRDYQMINPRELDIEPGFNARDYSLPENRAHLDRLKQLIREAGRVEKPIIVRLNQETGRATVTDGECRLRAVLELIQEGVEPFVDADMPCYPAPPGSDDPVVRRFASLNANEGKPLSKWELGKGYQALYDLNVSIDKIAKKTANTPQFVAEAMELANAPDEVKQLLSDAAVTPAEAKRVIRTLDADPDAVKKLQEAVQAKRAKGEKGPVKRAKARPRLPVGPSTPAPVQTAPASKPNGNGHAKPVISIPVEIEVALAAVLEDVPGADLYNVDNEWISVSRVKLLALTKLMSTDEPVAETVPEFVPPAAEFDTAQPVAVN